VQTPGTLLDVKWVDVPNIDPGAADAPVRAQVIAMGATPIQKAEGTWAGFDGSIWFVSSRGDGPICQVLRRNHDHTLANLMSKGFQFNRVTISTDHPIGLLVDEGREVCKVVSEIGAAVAIAANRMNRATPATKSRVAIHFLPSFRRSQGEGNAQQACSRLRLAEEDQCPGAYHSSLRF
jgi:hypothetical protein